jgi:hypothetical protein
MHRPVRAPWRASAGCSCRTWSRRTAPTTTSRGFRHCWGRFNASVSAVIYYYVELKGPHFDL